MIQEWSNKCSGRGTPARDRKCKCNKLFYGDFCQYQNDCEEDKDCNNHGKTMTYCDFTIFTII